MTTTTPRELAYAGSDQNNYGDAMHHALAAALSVALDQIDRLRGVIAEAVADAEYGADEGHDQDYGRGMCAQAKDTLAILANAVKS